MHFEVWFGGKRPEVYLFLLQKGSCALTFQNVWLE